MFYVHFDFLYSQDTCASVGRNSKRMSVFDDLEMIWKCCKCVNICILLKRFEPGSVINDKLSALIVQIRESHFGTASRFQMNNHH